MSAKLIKKVDDLVMLTDSLQETLNRLEDLVSQKTKEINQLQQKYENICMKLQESTNAQIRASFLQLRTEVQAEIRQALLTKIPPS